jgi:REP element-mobilizing transposase RayT
MLIKTGFSRQLPKGERINASRRGKGERGIWQRRYWEHAIRDEEDFRRHVDYIQQSGQARPRRAPGRLAPFQNPPLHSG